MVILDASGLPLAVHTDSASPHEVTLVQATLDETFTVGRLQRIIGDRAYDRDPRNRKRPATQDGRPLRRYRCRWKVERLFSWLNKYKHPLVRWDHCHERFTAFVQLVFSMIFMRKLCPDL